MIMMRVLKRRGGANALKRGLICIELIKYKYTSANEQNLLYIVYRNVSRYSKICENDSKCQRMTKTGWYRGNTLDNEMHTI